MVNETNTKYSPHDRDFMIVQDIYKNKNNSEEYIIIQDDKNNSGLNYKDALKAINSNLNINSITESENNLSDTNRESLQKFKNKIQDIKSDKEYIVNLIHKIGSKDYSIKVIEDDLFTEDDMKRLDEMSKIQNKNEVVCPPRNNNISQCKKGKEIVYDNPEKYGNNCPYIICKDYQEETNLFKNYLMTFDKPYYLHYSVIICIIVVLFLL